MMPYCGIKKTCTVLAGAVLLSLSIDFFSGKSELFFSLQHHLLSLWSPLSPSSIVVLFKWVAVDDSFNHCLWPSRERKREKRRLLMIEEKRAICIYHFQITLYDNAVERREKTHTHTDTHTHTHTDGMHGDRLRPCVLQTLNHTLSCKNNQPKVCPHSSHLYLEINTHKTHQGQGSNHRDAWIDEKKTFAFKAIEVALDESVCQMHKCKCKIINRLLMGLQSSKCMWD